MFLGNHSCSRSQQAKERPLNSRCCVGTPAQDRHHILATLEKNLASEHSKRSSGVEPTDRVVEVTNSAMSSQSLYGLLDESGIMKTR